MTNKLPTYCISLALMLAMACQPTTDNKQPDMPDSAGAATGTPDSLAKPDTTAKDTLQDTQYAAGTASKATEQLVRAYLQNSNKDDIAKGLVDSFSRKFIFYEYDLDDDGLKEIFVGLTGPYFCGSGGCTTLLLSSTGSLITRFTVSERPFIILANKTNNWKDLIVESNGKKHLIKYGKKGYPSNPSVQPVVAAMPEENLPKALNDAKDAYPSFMF